MRDELTSAGHAERRSGDERREAPPSEFMPRAEYERRHWRLKQRLWIFTLLNTALASFAVFLGQHWMHQAQQRSTAELRDESRAAELRSCESGGDNLIVQARSLDDLRQLAITSAPDGRRTLFIRQTQPAIDRTLSRAAGMKYHAPLPPGTVSSMVVREVQRLSEQRCQRRATAAFGADREPARSP